MSRRSRRAHRIAPARVAGALRVARAHQEIPMKALVVFYSRTGYTRALAQGIASALGAETEEITDRVQRRGILGYLRSGHEASSHRRTRIEPATHDPGAFDLVVVGTPVWRMSLSSPVRTYLGDRAAELPRVAFFCTMGRFGSERVFRQMAEVCSRAPVATLARTDGELSRSDLPAAIEAFAARLRSAPPPVRATREPIARGAHP
jgi:flavodoxin